MDCELPSQYGVRIREYTGTYSVVFHVCIQHVGSTLMKCQAWTRFPRPLHTYVDTNLANQIMFLKNLPDLLYPLTFLSLGNTHSLIRQHVAHILE